ncbi:MAG TPA: cytochrome c1 [Ramlibacter sp.]|jgi:ubiquinol-cytochrome c reductase cytochrome c1 subunit|uniref:cytochrome c1 n=1 Tax=Ramlibacter sp. TaxID=1917967 RepID=UPI002D4A3373|nr:cytochrome c1 [Ramlibacter sp.]HZY20134.1 cytochrome c1 [Ramlibacter sp.]
MKKLLLSLALSLAAVLPFTPAQAAGSEGVAWDRAPNLTNDLPALQNGAKIFVNYCVGCHSAAFMRYNRLRDIGLSEQQIKDNLLFTTDRVGDTIKAAIDPKQAKEWFGANPPDLTLIARSRSGHGGTGADYLYTFLRTFYRDPTKATGWNNLAFPNVGMPHALWQLQGVREPVFEQENSHGHEVQVFRGWKQVTPGAMTPVQYDQAVAQLVAYLQWMGEPTQNDRVRIGVWVLLFLLAFTVIAWRLNAAYWKDVR